MKNSTKFLVLLMFVAATVLAGCKKEPEGSDTSTLQADPKVSDTETDVDTATDASGEADKTENTDEQPPVADSSATQIIPKTAVGPITFGMSKDDVVAALGEPDKSEAGGVALFYPKSRGLSLTVSPIGGVTEIICWSDEYPIPFPDGMTTYEGTTAEGIGMGASKEQIIEAYGQPFKTSSQGSIETLYYIEMKAHFSLTGSKLVSLRLRGE